jgi:hypothetical protein
MKPILTIILSFIIQLGIGQIDTSEYYTLPETKPPSKYIMCGIPEIDSLIVTRHRLQNNINCIISTDLILWHDYQIEQWLNGQEEHLCIYGAHGITRYIDCGIDGYNHRYYLGDTTVLIPQPISYEGFMNWKAEIILNRD